VLWLKIYRPIVDHYFFVALLSQSLHFWIVCFQINFEGVRCRFFLGLVIPECIGNIQISIHNFLIEKLIEEGLQIILQSCCSSGTICCHFHAFLWLFHKIIRIIQSYLLCFEWNFHVMLHLLLMNGFMISCPFLNSPHLPYTQWQILNATEYIYLAPFYICNSSFGNSGLAP